MARARGGKALALLTLMAALFAVGFRAESRVVQEPSKAPVGPGGAFGSCGAVVHACLAAVADSGLARAMALAESKASLGNYEAAIVLLKKAVNANSTDPEAPAAVLKVLGYYVALGDVLRASETFSILRSHYPSYPVASDVKARICLSLLRTPVILRSSRVLHVVQVTYDTTSSRRPSRGQLLVMAHNKQTLGDSEIAGQPADLDRLFEVWQQTHYKDMLQHIGGTLVGPAEFARVAAARVNLGPVTERVGRDDFERAERHRQVYRGIADIEFVRDETLEMELSYLASCN